MAEYLIQHDTLVNIADAIRAKTSDTKTLTPDKMVNAINSIKSEEAGTTVYAILYDDGELSIQNDDTQDASKSVVNRYSFIDKDVWIDQSCVPWNADIYNIRSVCFRNDIPKMNFAYMFKDAYRLSGCNIEKVNLNNVLTMSHAYFNCRNLTGSPVCGDNVTSMYYAYSGCINLTGSPVCGDNVINMSGAYISCYNLTGSPVCGDNVTSMSSAYSSCYNLTGSPVCGDNVTSMYFTYNSCYNLTGSPVCGDNVTDMYCTYRNCYNLTGSPVCGNNVTNMAYAYTDCYNLTGSPVCGNNVTNMYYTYYNCRNLTGNAYFYSSSVTNVRYCFYNKNNSIRLNLYVPSNSTTNTTIHYNNSYSLVGTSITWTNAGTYQYNTTYNIYIYPVANVAAAREANGD